MAKFLQREGRCVAGGSPVCAGDDRLRLALSPGRLPRSVVYQRPLPRRSARHSRHHGLLPRSPSDGRTLTTCAADFLAGGTDVSHFEYLPRCRTVHLADRGVLAWYGTGADSGFATDHLNARIHPITGARASGGRGRPAARVVVPAPSLPHTLAGSSPGVNSKCLSLFPIFFDFPTGRDAVIFFPLTPGGARIINRKNQLLRITPHPCNDRGAESQEYPAYPAMGQSTPPEKGPFRRGRFLLWR